MVGTETDPTINALKRQEKREEAQEMLEKVYLYVKPIMRKRGYRVVYLSEFYPKNSRLLGINVNHGLRINLRLRQPYDKNRFLTFESVLDTMLHELTHNVFGPHDRKFFALYEELKDEMQTMILNGYRGDPFIGSGNRLGPLNGAARLPNAPLTAGGPVRTKRGKGYRLGGPQAGIPAGPRAGPLSRIPIKTLAADAAEKRRLADRVCANDVPFEDLGCEEITADEFYNPSRPSPSPAPSSSAAASASPVPRDAPAVIDLVEESADRGKPVEIIDLTN